MFPRVFICIQESKKTTCKTTCNKCIVWHKILLLWIFSLRFRLRNMYYFLLLEERRLRTFSQLNDKNSVYMMSVVHCKSLASKRSWLDNFIKKLQRTTKFYIIGNIIYTALCSALFCVYRILYVKEVLAHFYSNLKLVKTFWPYTKIFRLNTNYIEIIHTQKFPDFVFILFLTLTNFELLTSFLV